MTEHFVPLALDTYFRGDSAERAFCEAVGAGGNHVVAATAGGRVLGDERHLTLCENDLAPVLEAFQAIPKPERNQVPPKPGDVEPPERPAPAPPPGGLIVRVFCAYLEADENSGSFRKLPQWYYKENPDRWAAETQSDMLWLTEAEWRSLIPADARPGAVAAVDVEIQRRFFSTVGIDFMEGSVNALPARSAAMTVAVADSSPDGVTLRLEGHGHTGTAFADHDPEAPRSRGCAVRLHGEIFYDRAADCITRFDVAGVGRAWGNKMEYVRREISLDQYPWLYGIACEVVAGDSPAERIPPYNLLHYGAGQPYFNR